MWTQVLPNTLTDHLDFQSNSTLATSVYGDPFTVVAEYPVGTEVRTAIVQSYQHVQRLLCIVGISICVPLILFSLVLRERKLNGEQTLNKDDDQVRGREEGELVR
jgi:MFS transporter, SIT family, siderophore-iron:H+ symporter